MPTISSLSETSGKAGDSLVLTGTTLGVLASVMKVNFSNATETVTVSGTVTTAQTAVTCTVPVLPAPGQYNVSVTLSNGSTSNSKPFFDVVPPVCTSLSVTTGPVTPTASTTITGTGLAAVTGVSFGANSTTITSTLGDTQITCTPPADTSGFTTDTETVDVTLTSPGGTSALVGPPDQFTYYNAPTVTSVNPTTGTANESGVVVNGTHFVDSITVTFADHATPPNTFTATVTALNSNAQLVITTPAGLAATTAYDVSVTTPGGTGALASAFTTT